MAGRVLLIEDDHELGSQIVDHLQVAGFEALWWREGRRVPPGTLPDVELVILDLMLPGRYGLDVLNDVRACSEVPVLVLTARNETPDKVRAFQLGADDYMTKPFWPEELIERVRARLRRPALQRGEVLEVGPLRIDLPGHLVQMSGREVELTPAEWKILVALARRAGAAVTRAALVEAALDPERDGTERTLDVHVSHLRKKLGGAKLIETVWGIGYKLANGGGER